MGLVRRARGWRRGVGRGSWCCRPAHIKGDASIYPVGGLFGVLANVDVGMCTLRIDRVILFVTMESHDLCDRSLKPRLSCIPKQE